MKKFWRHSFLLLWLLLSEFGTEGTLDYCNKFVKYTPQQCATDKKCLYRSGIPAWTGRHYVNRVHHFCFLTDITSGKAPKPTLVGEAKKDCYKLKTGHTLHSAGDNPNWVILEHLVQHEAMSFQFFDNLPYVKYNTFLHFTYPVSKLLPLEHAPNPYFIEVTGISLKGELLHNFLHFRIFANHSVALATDQFRRDTVLHGARDSSGQFTEKPNYATGRISAALIMVKDQDGWPIGDFSRPVPCSRTCEKYSHDVYYGDETNALPCSFTPPFASSHPGMFVFDVDPGRYCTKPGNQSTFPNPASPAAPGEPVSEDPRLFPNFARMEGVRELHATWSFGHNTCNFAERLYIQTLIFEDVEKVYDAKFWWEKNDKRRPFLMGWSAQYNILKPKRSSLGAPDYVNLEFLGDRNDRGNDIDCHVALFDAEKTVPFDFDKFVAPSLQAINNPENKKIKSEIQIPTRTCYLKLMGDLFRKQKSRQYFGQNAPRHPATAGAAKVCRGFPVFKLSDEEKKIYDERPDKVTSFLLKEKNTGIRCPCPALPSTIPPENRTADPARLHGRLIHASHMAIAYMFLTPIACFVARYYKETFPTVFCFQEYWWFMWHVVILIAACLFNIGAITSIARKKQQDLLYGDNLKIHVIFGAISICVFYMEIISGFFRAAKPKKRKFQIFLHWFIGVMNNACAVMSMFAMAWVNQSGFSCNVAYTCIFWLVFVIICYVIMELKMYKVDRELKLEPRRSYLPPPVKRLFTREPPGRHFRMFMLAVFIFGLLIIQIFVSYYIWNSPDGASCEQEYRRSYNRQRPIREEDEDDIILDSAELEDLYRDEP